MKIMCGRCHKDISNKVNDRLNGYNIGKVVCPYCNHHNKRYLSEFDNILYFIVTSIIYSLAIFTIFLCFRIFKDYMLYLVIALIFIGVYFLLKNIGLYIYHYAFFKNGYKDIDLKQDASRIKSLRIQSIAFVAISFMYGIYPNMLIYYFILLLGFIGISIVKAYFALKSEYRDK
ncbi:MAG: hypothetical protein SPI53_03890 [Erysipelotrichaceae bacterium]|nr:hypothetical protein [Erysipelotrichaceae bacterium]